MDALQSELRAAYPGLKINLLGINQFDLASANADATNGRTLPWLQDVDANSDGQSDVWSSWGATWRDVVIVDGDNRRVATYNVTANNLATAENYAALRDMILDAAFSDQRPWCNWRNPNDANHDGAITELDAYCLIDRLNTIGADVLADPAQNVAISNYFDVNHDGYVAPNDCLLIINYLNANGLLNATPAAASDSYSTSEDQPLSIAAAAGVLANDIDGDGDTLTAQLTSQPTHGSLTLSANGGFTYTPTSNYNGVDTFRYVASDGQATSSTTVVTITVSSVNDAPLATVDSYSVGYGTALTVSAANGVLANDTDADGDSLTAQLNVAPAHGTASLSSNGGFTYQPAANFSGADSFRYTVSDGHGGSASATVTLAVQAANDFNVAANAPVDTVVGQVTPTSQVGTTRSYEFVDDTRPADLRLAPDDHFAGDASAPVVLIEYLDIQCPPCAAYHPIVRQMETQFAGNLLVVRRNLPLTSIHANAFAAAVAAEAANLQGAYEAFIDRVYQNQPSWASLSSTAANTAFESYATALGLNLTQFRADVASTATVARVQRDLDAAARLGLNSTPTFFLNGQRVASPPSTASGFSTLIQTALNQASAAFELDRKTGQLRVANSAAINPALNSAFDLNVRVRDTNGANFVVPVHITVGQ